MRIFLILREYSVKGPYTLDEILEFSMDPNDVLWVMGESRNLRLNNNGEIFLHLAGDGRFKPPHTSDNESEIVSTRIPFTERIRIEDEYLPTLASYGVFACMPSSEKKSSVPSGKKKKPITPVLPIHERIAV